MGTLYFIIEIFVTFIESLLCFIISYNVLNNRNIDLNALIKSGISAFILTSVVTIGNSISFVSPITMVVAPIAAGFITHIIFKKDFTAGFIICGMYYIFLIVSEMLVISLISILTNDPDFVIKIITYSNGARSGYILLMKSISVIAYFLLKERLLSANYRLFKNKILIIFVFISLIMNTKMMSYINENNVPALKMGISVLFVVFIFISALIIYLSGQLLKAKLKTEEQNYISLKNSLLEKQLRQINQLYEDSSKNFHEFKHHISAMNIMLENGSYEETRKYLKSIVISNKYVHEYSTGNEILDLVLNTKKAEIANNKIDLVVNYENVDNILIDEVDLCSVLSNILENAIEAVNKINKGIIYFNIKKHGNAVIIVCKNPCKEGLNTALLKSDKGTEHGWGLKIVNDIVKKYNGSCRIDVEDGYFIIRIMLIETVCGQKQPI